MSIQSIYCRRFTCYFEICTEVWRYRLNPAVLLPERTVAFAVSLVTGSLSVHAPVAHVRSKRGISIDLGGGRTIADSTVNTATKTNDDPLWLWSCRFLRSTSSYGFPSPVRLGLATFPKRLHNAIGVSRRPQPAYRAPSPPPSIRLQPIRRVYLRTRVFYNFLPTLVDDDGGGVFRAAAVRHR